MAELREPIVSLLGHVDHGKTTLLDRIAGSVRASKEAGGITQHIGAIEVPGSTVASLCAGVLAPEQMRVPGLLFIDTPGHRSFETMRRLGGSLADLAILVVDSREGMMPQTRESVAILREAKTPFAVALTKIDLLPGWRKNLGHAGLAEHLSKGAGDFSATLDQRVYSVAEELVGVGFSADRYDRVSDFTRNVGIVPVSAKSGAGVPELIALLVGLSQRFLREELLLEVHGGEATVLERSDQRGIGPVASVIVYRGRLAVGDDIVVNGRESPFSSRIRGLYRPEVPRAGKAPKLPRFESLPAVEAAAGVYLSASGIEEALPGGLLEVVRTPEEAEAARNQLVRASQPVAEIADSGVAIFADTLGALNALAFECRQAGIPVHEFGVGPVGRPTVIRMETVKDPSHRAVLAFNVPILPDAQPEGTAGAVRIFRSDVIYRAIEEYTKWKEEERRSRAARRRLELIHPAKVLFLPGFVFRVSKPAIVGIKVIAGTIRPGVRLMKVDGTEVGLLRSLQRENDSLPSAETGAEVAASIEGAVVGRSLREGDVLLVALTEPTVRALRKVDLTPAENALLDEVVRLHRSESPFWGQ